MRTFLLRIAWLMLVPLGTIAGFAGIELGLRFLPVTKGLLLAHDQGSFPLPAYEPNLQWTHSIGWDLRLPIHGRTNNFGQVSPFDYREGARILAVVGDSFVEGQLNNYPDSLQGRIAAALPAQGPVYSFGLGGNSLSDYVATVEIVAREFALDTCVFYIVDGDIRESFDGDPGHYRFVQDPGGTRLEYVRLPPVSWRGRLLRSIGESSLLFYMFSNLRFQPRDLLPGAMKSTPAPAPAATRHATRDRAGIEAFLDGIVSAGITPSRVVLVLDSDRFALYRRDSDARTKDDPAERDFLMSEATRRGFQVLDMSPIFAADYRGHRTYFDFYPLDRHLNAYGNALVAQHIAALLETRSTPEPQR